MSSEIKPWFTIAVPHRDIREGRLSEAVFAANLWAVMQGTAPEVYLDTEAFFSKTYITAGLKRILKKAANALSGDSDSGDRILTLQTTFGGGKTHALVALWHLAKYSEKIRSSSIYNVIREALGELPHQTSNVAVFTNQTCDATQGRITPEGVHTWTLWGNWRFNSVESLSISS